MTKVKKLVISDALLLSLGAKKTEDGESYVLNLMDHQIHFYFDEFYQEGEWICNNGYREEYVTTVDEVLQWIFDAGYESHQGDLKEARSRVAELED